MKRILSTLLAVAMLAAMLVVPAMAYDDPNEPAVKFITDEYLELNAYWSPEYTANHAYAFVDKSLGFPHVMTYDQVDYDNKHQGFGDLRIVEGTGGDRSQTSSNGPFSSDGECLDIYAVLWTELDQWLADCIANQPGTLSTHTVTYTNPFTGETKTVGTDVTATEAPTDKPVDTSTVDSTASGWAKKELAEAIGADFVPENLQGEYKTGVTRFEMAMMVVDLIETASGKYFGQFASEYLFGINPDRELVFYKYADMNYSKYDAEDIEKIASLCELGIINGVKTISVETADSDYVGRPWDKRITMNFSPEGTLTRAQIAAILQRTGKVLGLTNTANSTFSDVGDNWVKPGVDFVYANGIMKGVGGNKFAPNRTLTREQAIVTTLRFYKALGK